MAKLLRSECAMLPTVHWTAQTWTLAGEHALCAVLRFSPTSSFHPSYDCMYIWQTTGMYHVVGGGGEVFSFTETFALCGGMSEQKDLNTMTIKCLTRMLYVFAERNTHKTVHFLESPRIHATCCHPLELLIAPEMTIRFLFVLSSQYFTSTITGICVSTHDTIVLQNWLKSYFQVPEMGNAKPPLTNINSTIFFYFLVVVSTRFQLINRQQYVRSLVVQI